MISSSSSMMFPLLSASLPLTGEFTSLSEPTEVSGVVAAAFFLSMDPKESDLRGEESPKTRRES
jgi:hypothetical protein